VATKKTNNQKIQRIIFWVNYWFILFGLIVFRLPVAFGFRYDLGVRFLFLVPYLGLIVISLKCLTDSRIKIHLNNRVLVYGMAFMLLEIIGLIRTALGELSFNTFRIAFYLFSYIVLGAVVFTALVVCNGNWELQARIRTAVLYSFGLYVTLDLILHLAGVNQPYNIYLTKYPAQLASLFGFSVYRVLFPTADGINAFGILSGLTFSALGTLAVSSRGAREKCLAGLMAFSSLIVMIMTDSRAAILFSFVVIGLVFLNPRFSLITRWIPFLVSLMPLIFILNLPISRGLSWMNRPDIPWEPLPDQARECEALLQRADGTLSNRPLIWEVAFDEFKHPSPMHIVGYGYRGHVVSGLSMRYSCLFQSYALPELASVHNIWLQILVDLGYIGLFIVATLCVLLIGKLLSLFNARGDPTLLSLLASLLFILCEGSLDSALTPDTYGNFIMFLYIVLIAMVSDPLTHPQKQG
jgi:hypothetical protein